ncbi:hypothetical protein D3C81_413550 [compost metagenome]
MGSSLTLDNFSHRVVNHVADARDPNEIDTYTKSFYGGDGDDVVSLSAYILGYFNATAEIHGGGGIDTLKLTSTTAMNTPLNLTVAKILGELSSMEIIDLVGRNHSVYLSAKEVLENGAVDAFYQGDSSRVQMMIKGVAGNQVALLTMPDLASNFGYWVPHGVVSVDGVNYNSYQHTGLAAELLVQASVTMNVLNSSGLVPNNAYQAETVDGMGYSTDAAMLTLNLSQVLNEGSVNLFHESDSTQMMVNGGAGDSINLDDLLGDGMTDLGDWAVTGSQTVDGVAYNVYQHSGVDAELLVQDAVKVNLI